MYVYRVTYYDESKKSGYSQAWYAVRKDAMAAAKQCDAEEVIKIDFCFHRKVYVLDFLNTYCNNSELP